MRIQRRALRARLYTFLKLLHGVLPVEVWGLAAHALQVGLIENTESTTVMIELAVDAA